MSRHKHYHIPEREARRAAQLERKAPRGRQTDIAESREELLALLLDHRRRLGGTTDLAEQARLRAIRYGYAPHQGPAERARRVALLVAP